MHADTTLHFDISSGIAGDMALAVLHGLGLDLNEITDIVHKMTGERLSIEIEKTFINGIETNRLKIDIPHEHAHRKMHDIKAMIEKADLPKQAAADALGIFSIVADAEGWVHGKSSDEVHFHEIGALDSILDIVGFAYGVHRLGIREITSSKPVLGTGFVECAHGKVPLPAPATLKILEGVEVIRTSEPNELTTPTGAAILKYYVNDFSPEYTGRILASSYSTGTMSLKTMANILRGTLLSKTEQPSQITVIETNIDDSTGEVIGDLFSRMKDDILDIYTTHVTGKKNRPAIHLTILCENDKLEAAAEKLFEITTTAGIRHRKTDRIVMNREFTEVEVYGEIVRIKRLTYKGIEKYSPEWDDCVKASEKLNLAPLKVFNAAQAEFT